MQLVVYIFYSLLSMSDFVAHPYPHANDARLILSENVFECVHGCVCGVCLLQCSVRCVHRGQQHVTASHMTLSATREQAALQSFPPFPLHSSLFTPPTSPLSNSCSFLSLLFFSGPDFSPAPSSRILYYFPTNTPTPLFFTFNSFPPIQCMLHPRLFLCSSFSLTLCAFLVSAVDLSKNTFV